VAGTLAASDHGVTAVISLLKKAFWVLIVVCGSASPAFAQSTFFEVVSTPYDYQMERIQPTLTTPSAYMVNGLSLTIVNEWMIELRAMPYRYSHEWRTPSEVEAAQAADCKGKALALYDRMQLNGATNLRFVIGKRRATDSLTHAWLEWQTAIGTLLLDPTFNWNAAFKIRDRRSYIAFYGYEGAHKFQAADTLLASRNLGVRAPTAPADGVIPRPVRLVSRFHSSPWILDEGSIDPRFFSNRPVF